MSSWNYWNGNNGNRPHESSLVWKHKKSNYNKYSAGVLPYSYDQTGNCFLLLGKDYSGEWSDFGGRSEYIDKNNPCYTASREFYEETLGSIMSIQESIDKIQNGNPIKIISKTLNGSPYYMYLLYVDFSNYIETFNKTSNFVKYICLNKNTLLEHKLIEKVLIRWVSLDTILSCIELSDNSSELPIRLRSVFLKSILLCKSELIGIGKN